MFFILKKRQRRENNTEKKLTATKFRTAVKRQSISFKDGIL
jgi:hypothetical protein